MQIFVFDIFALFEYVYVQAWNAKGMCERNYLGNDYDIPQLLTLLFVFIQDIGDVAWCILLLYSCLYVDVSCLNFQ